ncbi:helix-turn-helix domain-containing protein [Rhizobium sp.]
MSNVADSLRRGLNEALAFVERSGEANSYGVHVPETIDVKAIRLGLEMTQQEFAGHFGFSVNTLRHWEQGARQPEGPTRASLRVIEKSPQAVQEALRVK